MDGIESCGLLTFNLPGATAKPGQLTECHDGCSGRVRDARNHSTGIPVETKQYRIYGAAVCCSLFCILYFHFTIWQSPHPEGDANMGRCFTPWSLDYTEGQVVVPSQIANNCRISRIGSCNMDHYFPAGNKTVWSQLKIKFVFQWPSPVSKN